MVMIGEEGPRLQNELVVFCQVESRIAQKIQCCQN
jgi:hypothetical protein